MLVALVVVVMVVGEIAEWMRIMRGWWWRVTNGAKGGG